MLRSKMTTLRGIAALLFSMGIVLGSALVLFGQTNPVTERFTFAVATNEPGSTGKSPLKLVLHRWSTSAERDRLYSLVTEGGSAKVLDALRDAYAVGYIDWPGQLQYTLRYAYNAPRPDGGQDVVFIADQPMWTWWQSANVSRTPDTAFTVIQLQISKEGAGEAKLSLGGKIGPNKAMGVVLEDYATQPTLLTEVRRDKLTS